MTCIPLLLFEANEYVHEHTFKSYGLYDVLLDLF